MANFPTPPARDAVVTVKISRTQLGLADLDLMDHLNYITSGTFMGAGVTYRRQQIRSPYVEGATTVNRVRDQVQDQIAIDVLADTQAHFQTNIATLQNAFAQDTFVLTMTLDTVVWAWQCEASDYQMDWSIPRIHGLYGQIKYTLLRQPILVTGPNT